MSFPALDLARFEAADAAGRRAIGAEVDSICRATGFLTLTGHGVPEPVRDALWREAEAFFAAPTEAKRAAKAPYPGYPYGYLPPLAEALARSKGENTPPDLKESFNGGPGAPAFIYARPDLIAETRPALSGWLGHAAPFAFDLGYRPAEDIERLRVGTPPVLQRSVLEAALDVFDLVDMAQVRARSIELSELFIAEVEARCPQLTLASPREAAGRGSQVSFAFEQGYAAMQALIARGVIGDFRAPDIMRFGFTPLYIGEAEVIAAAQALGEVIGGRLWDRPEYRVRAAVT